MLILNASQVHFHRVVLNPKHQAEGHSSSSQQAIKVLPGVVYKEKLYRPVETFALSAQDQAIKTARRLYLNTKGQFSILVVETPKGHSVWCQDPALMLWRQYKAEQSPVNGFDLDHVTTLMRSFGGVQIRDRRYKLKNYSRCFVGSDAVAWMMRNLEISETEAIALGQRLINEKWMHHVVDEHGFANELLFYRFYKDEGLDAAQPSAS